MKDLNVTASLVTEGISSVTLPHKNGSQRSHNCEPGSFQTFIYFRVISGPLPQNPPQTQHAFSPKVSPKVLGFSPNLFGEPNTVGPPLVPYSGPRFRPHPKMAFSPAANIINSFIVVKQRHTVDKDTGQVVVSDIKLNNGLMENRNSIIKTIKKAANGYTNWERFRSRCLYVLRKSSNPMLNPAIPPKKTRQ